MTDTPPDWVLLEAAKRFAWCDTAPSRLRKHYQADNYNGYTALCDMIFKHEQPPVDRKLLCAEEALRTAWLRNPQGLKATDQCIRAIELWEEGFGK